MTKTSKGRGGAGTLGFRCGRGASVHQCVAECLLAYESMCLFMVNLGVLVWGWVS